jgi:glutamate-1-semialdehyde 2,1-aminomutase
MVGGVSSPVRAFKSVGGSPLFIARGKGCEVWDVDGNRFTDYVCSWGALILGHADPRVLSRVTSRMKGGTSFGAPTSEELRLAERICRSVPSIEKVRFVSSGTEATMSALRVARGFTQRPKFVKFKGCYHGHSDPFLTEAGSGMATFDLSASAGVTTGSTADTITLPYNDATSVEDEFRRQGEQIAAVLVEPVAGNMGVVLPDRDFLRALKRLTAGNGSLLIFDEVITGFRLARGGAQELYGLVPDLTTLGKVIGGGFPVGAFGGRKEVMSVVSPEGPVYQAGTLSGNPVAMAAGSKTLEILNRSSYATLDKRARELEEGLLDAAGKSGVPLSTNRAGSMLGVFLMEKPPRNFAEAKQSDTSAYSKFFWEMLREGAYLPPSAFETLFVSLAHKRRDIEATIRAAKRAFRAMGA